MDEGACVHPDVADGGAEYAAGAAYREDGKAGDGACSLVGVCALVCTDVYSYDLKFIKP